MGRVLKLTSSISRRKYLNANPAIIALRVPGLTSKVNVLRIEFDVPNDVPEFDVP